MFVRKMWGAPTVCYKNESSGMQTVTNKVELPGWVTDAAIKNLQQSYNVSQAMPGPYSGDRYAGITDGMRANIAGLQQNVGQTEPAFALAKSGAAGMMNYQPSNVQSGAYNAAQISATPQMDSSRIGAVPQMQASYVGGIPEVSAQNVANIPRMQANMIGSAPSITADRINGTQQVGADQIMAQRLAGMDLNTYMNPYTQGVVDYGLKALETQRLQSLNGIGDQAARSGAFGGSRQGILEGVTNATSAMNAGKLASDLMSQNYMQAQNAAIGDITRNLASQQANQAANLQARTTNAQTGLQAAMANQSAGLSANQANMQAIMEANRLNQAAGMTAQQTNINSALQSQLANQAAGLTAGQANQNAFLRGALANQQADMTAGSANQSAAMQAALANQQADMSAGSTNLAALMQSALANQSAENSAAQFNVGNNLQAQLANQSAGLQGAGLNLNAANMLGSLTTQGQQAYLDALRSAMTGQTIYQQDKQGEYDALKQAYYENRDFPLQQLQIPLQALGMTPYGQTQTSTGPAQPQAGGSGLLQGIGAGASAIGAIGSLVSAFGGSDESLKTDIKKIGKDDETGLDIYSYRYKGDPKTYPKVVGPMAQDIAKGYPDQVRKIGGKMAVNLGFGPMQRAFN